MDADMLLRYNAEKMRAAEAQRTLGEERRTLFKAGEKKETKTAQECRGGRRLVHFWPHGALALAGLATD